MGQVLWGKGRFRRLLAVHFTSSNSFPAESTSWAVAADVAWLRAAHASAGGRSLLCWGKELWDQVRADRLLQFMSLAVLLCCIWVGMRWFYCFFKIFIFAHKLFWNTTLQLLIIARHSVWVQRVLRRYLDIYFWLMSPTVLFRISRLPSYKI